MKRTAPNRQTGYATLTLSVVMLLIVSLVGIYLNRATIADIRTSANQVRRAQAVANAEYFMERGIAFLRTQTTTALNPGAWPLCDSNGFTFANKSRLDLAVSPFAAQRCLVIPDDGITDPDREIASNVFIAAQQQSSATGTPYAGKWIYTVIAVATNSQDDDSALAVVRQSLHYAMEGRLAAAPPPPLMAGGNVSINGNLTIVTNPNGGCGGTGACGVPVSVWSAGPTAGSGSWQSCQQAEYAAGTCGSGSSPKTLSTSSSVGKDIVANDAANPAFSDMFNYVFGYTSAQYQNFLSDPNFRIIQATTCTGLAATVNNLDRVNDTRIPIIWVSAPSAGCDVPANSTIGSEAAPVVLITENTEFKMNSNSDFYGLLFGFGSPGSGYDAGNVDINGTAKFYGSILSNDKTNLGQTVNGSFKLIYTDAVVRGITNSISQSQSHVMVRIPGSWADYLY